MLKKIISGAQTGADFAGLIVAKHFGYETGGWMPKGYKNLDGFHLGTTTRPTARAWEKMRKRTDYGTTWIWLILAVITPSQWNELLLGYWQMI
jgi:hypothetical protein